MKRRDFVTLLGTAFISPLAAHAQKKPPVIGFLSGGAAGPFAGYAAAFRQGLREAGIAEGTDVLIEYRWADGQLDRLPALAADLARQNVSVIFASGSRDALIAKKAAPTVPLVFTGGADPVAIGLVASINKPGGNVTGVTMLAHFSAAKRFELLIQLAPRIETVALLINPTNPSAAENLKDTQAAAKHYGLTIVPLNVSAAADIDGAFARAAEHGAKALVSTGDTLFGSHRKQLAALAMRYRLPTIYTLRDYVVDGSLMSYGASFADSFRQAGTYVARILRGEKPSELPVLLPTRFEFVINLKTAKTLGIAIPPALLALADEVIE
jgi:putative ABC transport system substrate-binding protein